MFFFAEKKKFPFLILDPFHQAFLLKSIWKKDNLFGQNEKIKFLAKTSKSKKEEEKIEDKNDQWVYFDEPIGNAMFFLQVETGHMYCGVFCFVFSESFVDMKD